MSKETKETPVHTYLTSLIVRIRAAYFAGVEPARHVWDLARETYSILQKMQDLNYTDENDWAIEAYISLLIDTQQDVSFGTKGYVK